MKKENGVTLVSLVVYVIAMIIVLGIMNSIITNFYNNTSTVQGNVQEIVYFNKFNTYFLKEVKSYNNKVDKIEDNYILFTSGNSFSISEGRVYYNNIKLCDNAQSLQFALEQDTENIINVTLRFKNFSKSITYKLENIY